MAAGGDGGKSAGRAQEERRKEVELEYACALEGSWVVGEASGDIESKQLAKRTERLQHQSRMVRDVQRAGEQYSST